MIKKRSLLAGAVILLFLLPMFFSCKTDAGGDSDDTESKNDSYVPQVNPFIGVWKETDEKFWQFKTNGTGGTAATQAGPFRDDFSFFVFISEEEGIAPSLVTLEDILPASPPADASTISVARYTFSIEGDHATLTQAEGGTNVELHRVSGKPQALNLTNPLIGEWATKWTLNGTSWMPGTNQWSLKYRDDGTVLTYHHSAGHQFENAYALRGNTLTIYGQRRFASDTAPITAEISPLGNDTWRVEELTSNFPVQNSALVKWIYTKVDAAKWKEE